MEGVRVAFMTELLVDDYGYLFAGEESFPVDVIEHIVQVVAILDVVDLESSVVKDYGSYTVVEFPIFRAGAEDEVRSRVFRSAGGYTELFVGGDVKASLDGAGIVGLSYVPVPFTL
jgi:hypothetical protein